MAKLAPTLPVLGRSDASLSHIPTLAVVSQSDSGSATTVSNFGQAEDVVESTEENGRKRRRSQVRLFTVFEFSIQEN